MAAKGENFRCSFDAIASPLPVGFPEKLYFSRFNSILVRLRYFEHKGIKHCGAGLLESNVPLQNCKLEPSRPAKACNGIALPLPYMFRALPAHLQEALHKQRLVHYVRVMSVGWYQFRSNPGSKQQT
jgi:hypothetical protein